MKSILPSKKSKSACFTKCDFPPADGASPPFTTFPNRNIFPIIAHFWEAYPLGLC